MVGENLCKKCGKPTAQDFCSGVCKFTYYFDDDIKREAKTIMAEIKAEIEAEIKAKAPIDFESSLSQEDRLAFQELGIKV